uniref:oleoyl-[acyl-carrier-protein] hydrolase n=1 Tax=Plectus sambesii TaxID=2011161 RepID=A0A914WMB5_9BILA
MYPVELEIGDDLGSSISNIKECLRQVPNKGIGYGTIFGYLEKALPQVSFNYLGQFDQGTSATGFWSLVDVTGEYGLDRSASSEEANDNVIDVTGLCFNGHMCFNIASHLSLEETERFKAVFKMKLEQIIEHTLSFVHPQKDIKESTSTGMAVDHFEPYFEFHNPPGGAVLFILPPGEGGAESYFNNIVQQLTQFKLVLFNNYYLHLKSPQTSFEELAKFYISYVKQIQPKGPYNFLGWSFGGVLSLEISRQLVGAGEKIDNLIFIDSYFNVKKACSAINQADEVDIIDRINYFYSPKAADMKQLVSNTRNIVLFKAAKLNDTYRSDNQLLLFDYYMKSDFNNLDTLMDPQSIKLFHLADDTHASWVKNERQVTSMCNSISSKLKQAVGK